MSPGDQLGGLHGVDGVSPDVPIVHPGLTDALGDGQFGDDAAEEVEAVQDLQGDAGTVAGEDGQQLIPHPLRRNPVDQGRVGAD